MFVTKVNKELGMPEGLHNRMIEGIKVGLAMGLPDGIWLGISEGTLVITIVVE